MKVRVTSLIVLTACWLMLGTAASAQDCSTFAGNLVVNCGFETGDFTGWTQGGNTGFTGVDGNPDTGSFAAFFGPVGSDGTLTQLVGDNSTSYYVQFRLFNDGGTPNDFTVIWNGVDVGPDLVDVDAFDYTTFAGTLPGNFGAGSNSLTFQMRQDPAFWFLDNVVVLNANTTVPEPGTLVMFGSGILGLAGLVRRKLLL